jgi:hypothetical protein
VHHLTGEQQQHRTTPLDRRIHLPNEWQIHNDIAQHNQGDKAAIGSVDQPCHFCLGIEHSVQDEVAGDLAGNIQELRQLLEVEEHLVTEASLRYIDKKNMVVQENKPLLVCTIPASMAMQLSNKAFVCQ